MDTTRVVLALMLAGAFTAATAEGQELERRFRVGGHSAVIGGTMELSGIDPAIADLPRDGIQGPHSSGLFFLFLVKPGVRLGLGTLVGNSTSAEPATMNYQAAGPIADLEYGGRVVVVGGLQVGAMIVNAMQSDGVTSSPQAQTGTFYKDEGVFAAPYVGLGLNLRSFQLRAFVRRQFVASDDPNSGIGAFGGTYVGLMYSLDLSVP